MTQSIAAVAETERSGAGFPAVAEARRASRISSERQAHSVLVPTRQADRPNLSENGKAFTFLRDYPNRRRIKIWGEAVENDPEVPAKVAYTGYKARPESVFVFPVKDWDVNCSQHVQPRFTQRQMRSMLEALHGRVKPSQRHTSVDTRKPRGDPHTAFTATPSRPP